MYEPRVVRNTRAVSIRKEPREDTRRNVHCVEDREKVVRDARRDAAEVGVYRDVDIWNEKCVEQPRRKGENPV